MKHLILTLLAFGLFACHPAHMSPCPAGLDVYGGHTWGSGSSDGSSSKGDHGKHGKHGSKGGGNGDFSYRENEIGAAVRFDLRHYKKCPVYVGEKPRKPMVEK